MEENVIYDAQKKITKRDRLGAISETMDVVVTEARVASIRKDLNKLTVLKGIADQYVDALEKEIQLIKQTTT